MKTLTVDISDGPYSLCAVAVLAGRDLSVTICGGTSRHIGAAAIGIPRPSLKDPEKTSASVSVFCVTGHKEDLPARDAAQLLASRYDCVADVSVGIHLDNATVADIDRFNSNFQEALRRLTQALDHERAATP